MHTVALIGRIQKVSLLVLCIGLLAGCTNTNQTATVSLTNKNTRESVSVSTYAPPRQQVEPAPQGWPRLVDSKRGLMAEHAKVRVQCLKPELISLLNRIERKFGKKPIITSGYRSPAYNRRVRGAKRSKHMSCEAADIWLPGVSKWTLAKYVRALPDRGGVGTYCKSRFVHVDVSTKRDWNWGCRKGRKRKS